MRVNFGCQLNKPPEWVNLDKYEIAEPDVLFDLESVPWPFDSDSVTEALFNHSLEHIGQDSNVYLGVIGELYRVCSDGAVVKVNAPHPRHDHFSDDPTHVPVITPDVFNLFSKKNCEDWQRAGVANSPLALYLNVNFEVTSIVKVLDPKYYALWESKKISQAELEICERDLNNVVQEYQIALRVLK
jgi:hypothetical protein